MDPAAYNYGKQTGDILNVEGFQASLSAIQEEWIMSAIHIILPDHMTLTAHDINTGNIPQPYWDAMANHFMAAHDGMAIYGHDKLANPAHHFKVDTDM